MVCQCLVSLVQPCGVIDMEQNNKIKKRNMSFATRTKTRIWHEKASKHNPYLAEQCRCHGYDILELARKRSLVEVIFLLFHGELPSSEQAELLETLMVACINPGPRHPATRAAMNAGVGKSRPAHILPIGLSVLGGGHLGGEEVGDAMIFLRQNIAIDPAQVASELSQEKRADNGDWHIAPGFGSRFGSLDPHPQQTAKLLGQQEGAGRFLAWGENFATEIAAASMGWLSPGVVAAVLCELDFHPRAGAGLFQLICAPGILAHGLELANKPITAMPFLDEDHYDISPNARKD